LYAVVMPSMMITDRIHNFASKGCGKSALGAQSHGRQQTTAGWQHQRPPVALQQAGALTAGASAAAETAA